MTKSIYVGNLSFKASEDEIRALFSAHGNVHGVKVVMDRETGRPRGFAFVEMDGEDAEAAIRALDGKEFIGRPLRVNMAQERERSAGPRNFKRA
ncbi:MAG: RNA-binding protein [Gammaproteobacteria bacterium]|nr:RNA-binding protein [Gammaproteobacteria bacterium]